MNFVIGLYLVEFVSRQFALKSLQFKLYKTILSGTKFVRKLRHKNNHIK